MDEASHVHESLFFKILLPLMARKDHYLVALTTPKHGNDEFSRMVATRAEDGSLYYNVIMMGDPCEDCAASQQPWTCTHKHHEIAAWKDPVRMARWQHAYVVANRMTDLMQENFSTGGMKDNLVFNTKLVDALEKRPKVAINSDVAAIYLAIDPAGGGPGSDMAITAIAQYRHMFVVCLSLYRGCLCAKVGVRRGVFYFFAVLCDNSSRISSTLFVNHALIHATVNASNVLVTFTGVTGVRKTDFSGRLSQSTNAVALASSTHIFITLWRMSGSFTMAASTNTVSRSLSPLSTTSSNTRPW